MNSYNIFVELLLQLCIKIYSIPMLRFSDSAGNHRWSVSRTSRSVDLRDDDPISSLPSRGRRNPHHGRGIWEAIAAQPHGRAGDGLGWLSAYYYSESTTGESIFLIKKSTEMLKAFTTMVVVSFNFI